MNVVRRYLVIILFGITTLATAKTWHIAPEGSHVNFLSLKNQHIIELHAFKRLTGVLDDTSCEAKLSIDLASVETNIPIRNQRMRQLLFEVQRFPTAEIILKLPKQAVTYLNVPPGSTVEAEAIIQLHGMQKSYPVNLTIFPEVTSVWTITTQPLLISAQDFNLQAGVQALQNIVGLQHIATQVPVYAQLKWTP